MDGSRASSASPAEARGLRLLRAALPAPLLAEALLLKLPGGGWTAFAFSPDDRRLAFVEYVSARSRTYG